jgi:hypothetical protein
MNCGFEKRYEAAGLGAFRAGKPANSPVGAISRRRGYLIGSTPFFISHARDAAAAPSVSIIARRRRTVAAQRGACVPLGGPRAILMRDIASRNAPRHQERGNQKKYRFHNPSLACQNRATPFGPMHIMSRWIGAKLALNS